MAILCNYQIAVFRYYSHGLFNVAALNVEIAIVMGDRCSTVNSQYMVWLILQYLSVCLCLFLLCVCMMCICMWGIPRHTCGSQRTASGIGPYSLPHLRQELLFHCDVCHASWPLIFKDPPVSTSCLSSRALGL